MTHLVVLKQDRKTGSRAVGVRFLAPTYAANIWIGLGLVRDVNAPIPKTKKRKKTKRNADK